MRMRLGQMGRVQTVVRKRLPGRVVVMHAHVRTSAISAGEVFVCGAYVLSLSAAGGFAPTGTSLQGAASHGLRIAMLVAAEVQLVAAEEVYEVHLVQRLGDSTDSPHSRCAPAPTDSRGALSSVPNRCPSHAAGEHFPA